MAALTPLQFLSQYRNLRVTVNDASKLNGTLGQTTYTVQLKTYYQYSLNPGADASHYSVATAGPAAGKTKANRMPHSGIPRIRKAHHGGRVRQTRRRRIMKLALQWAVMSGKIKNPSQSTIQQWSDAHLGIDCSGFAANYLIASGKRVYSYDLLVNHSNASSYFNTATPVNDPLDVRRGDLLLFIKPGGHIAVVESLPGAVEGIRQYAGSGIDRGWIGWAAGLMVYRRADCR